MQESEPLSRCRQGGATLTRGCTVGAPALWNLSAEAGRDRFRSVRSAINPTPRTSDNVITMPSRSSRCRRADVHLTDSIQIRELGESRRARLLFKGGVCHRLDLLQCFNTREFEVRCNDLCHSLADLATEVSLAIENPVWPLKEFI